MLLHLVLALFSSFAPHAALPSDAHGDPLPSGAKARLGTLRWRHAHPVTALAPSPDGKRFACGCEEGSIYLWESATGKRQQIWTRKGQKVRQLLWSHDGTWLFSAHEGGLVLKWALATGKAQVFGEFNSTTLLALAPDGRTLALGEGSGMVRLWDLLQEKEISAWQEQSSMIATLAFSPDGQLLAWGYHSGSFSLIALKDPAKPRAFRAPSDGVGAIGDLAFSADGKTIYAAQVDADRSRLIVWDVATGTQTRVEERMPAWLQLSPTGASFLGLKDGVWGIWDTESGKKRCTLKVPAGMQMAAFSADGKTLAILGRTNSLSFWSTRTGAAQGTDNAPSTPVRQLAFTREGKQLIALHEEDRNILFWDLKTQQIGRILTDPATNPSAFALAPDETTLASAVSGGTVRFWPLVSGKKATAATWGTGKICSLHYTADGKALLTSGGVVDRGMNSNSTPPEFHPKGRVCRWQIESERWQEIHGDGEIHGCQVVTQCELSSDGQLAASDRNENEIVLWHPLSGRLLGTLEKVQGHLTAFTLAGDGRLVAGTVGDSIALWETATGKLRARWWQTSECTPVAVRFSPTGQLLAVGTKQGEVRLYDPLSGKCLQRWRGHEGAVTRLAFGPAGDLLASGGTDSAILLWPVPRFPARSTSSLTPAQFATLWQELGSADAGQAQQAMVRLRGDPARLLPYLEQRLHPDREGPAVAQVQQWFKQLDDDDFEIREQALRELRKHAPRIVPSLHQTLGQTDSVEVRARVQAVFTQLEKHSLAPEELRQVRAIEVLNQIPTPASRDLLGRLARGYPWSPQTQAAQATLYQRPPSTPR